MNNSNRIALWFNDKREKQSQPHLRGQGEVSGDFWASAWFSDEISDDDKRMLAAILKRYNSKKPFISISLQVKQNQGQQAAQQQSVQQAAPVPRGGIAPDFDDDIPF